MPVPGAVSPLVTQYGGWAAGRPASSLPRSIEEFLSGAFGPLAPIRPAGIDQPPEGAERAEPRRFQYPVGFNLPIGVPGSEGLKLASFSMLRTWREAYSVVGACISVRKQEILGLGWDIVPTDMAEKAMKNDAAAHADFHERRQQALAFFRRPDPNYYNFQSWFGAAIEDVLVTDALAFYLHPTRLPGKGPFASNLAALALLDGSTIKPLVDIHGSIPRPPNPAYQQYLWGVPRTEYMVPDGGNDADASDELGPPDQEYRGDQLLYLPYVRRTWTPYGFSPTEQAMLPIMIGLKRLQWVLDWFTEGSIPGMFVMPGPEISTPQQIQQLQSALNAVAGDRAIAHRIVVLPGGSNVREQKPPHLADQADEIIYQNVLMSYDVMPMELGIMPKVSSTQSPGAANQMAKASADIQQRKALKPMLQWWKVTLFDHVLQRIFGQTDMQWVWDGMQPVQDEQMAADTAKAKIQAGLSSIDEERVKLGDNPWGLPETSTPFVMTTAGPVWLEGALAAQAAPSTEETGPEGESAPAAGGDASTGAHQVPDQSPGPDAGGTAAKSRTDYAALRLELDQLGAYLRHGRDIRKFRASALSPATIQRIADDMAAHGRGYAIRRAIKQAQDDQRAEQQRRRREARDAAVATVSAAVAAKLGTLTRQVKQDKLGSLQFVDQASDVMGDGYGDAYQMGAEDYAPDYSLTPADQTAIAGRASVQRPFLQGLATDILAGLSAAALASRLALYGSTVNAAYEEGFGAAVRSVMSEARIIWHTQDDEACEFCGPRDGQEYTFETLPNWPGDGGFGGPECAGGPQCRCDLEYVEPEAPA